MSPTTAALREAIASNPSWYHVLELAPGVRTPGHVDHRAVAERVLPRDLRGRRALDVGTFDGFWAFAMEQRGAEVVAIDLDDVAATEWPPRHRDRTLAEAARWDVELGRGFRIAAEALGSSARRVGCDVYELDADAIGGPVDVAFVGAILLHLRDPVRALERVREVLAPDGRLVLLESISVMATVRAPRRPIAEFRAHATPFTWWVPNVAAVRAWALAAGFVGLRTGGLHRPPALPQMRGTYLGLHARRS